MRDYINLIENALSSELDEQRLPLRKGVNANAKGNYSAFVAVMDPKDFIRLTTGGEKEYQDIFDQTKIDLDTFKSGSNEEFNKERYNIPFLRVRLPSGKITSHEGRHRAAMVANAGGDKFPVAIDFQSDMTYSVSYDESDYDNDTEESRTEYFDTIDQMSARIHELETANKDMNGRYYYFRIKSNIEDGHKFKGSPRTSKPDSWIYGAWTKDDMPEQLRGQYNDSVIIPTSRMRYGPIKGYKHFKR